MFHIRCPPLSLSSRITNGPELLSTRRAYTHLTSVWYHPCCLEVLNFLKLELKPYFRHAAPSPDAT